jgi:hypothetical protein
MGDDDAPHTHVDPSMVMHVLGMQWTLTSVFMLLSIHYTPIRCIIKGPNVCGQQHNLNRAAGQQ